VSALARVKRLSAIHIKFNGRLEPCRHSAALHIACQCSSTISQVGVETTVWKVERRVLVEKGTAYVDRFITEVMNPDIPEHFLVRT